MASERKFFVGGNWKMNGSKAKVDDILKFMNDATFNADKTGEYLVSFPIPSLNHGMILANSMLDLILEE